MNTRFNCKEQQVQLTSETALSGTALEAGLPLVFKSRDPPLSPSLTRRARWGGTRAMFANKVAVRLGISLTAPPNAVHMQARENA